MTILIASKTEKGQVLFTGDRNQSGSRLYTVSKVQSFVKDGSPFAFAGTGYSAVIRAFEREFVRGLYAARPDGRTLTPLQYFCSEGPKIHERAHKYAQQFSTEGEKPARAGFLATDGSILVELSGHGCLEVAHFHPGTVFASGCAEDLCVGYVTAVKQTSSGAFQMSLHRMLHGVAGQYDRHCSLSFDACLIRLKDQEICGSQVFGYRKPDWVGVNVSLDTDGTPEFHTLGTDSANSLEFDLNSPCRKPTCMHTESSLPNSFGIEGLLTVDTLDQFQMFYPLRKIS